MLNSTDAIPASLPSNNQPAPQARFELGRIVATPGALRLLGEHGVNLFDLLVRHVSGDWGDVCVADAQANNDALINGERVLSAYTLVPGAADTRVWLISERDRSVTTALRPDEY